MLSSEVAKSVPVTETVKTSQPAGSPANPGPVGNEERNPSAISGQNLPQEDGKAPVSRPKVDEAVSHLNEFVQSIRRNLEFSIDEESGRTVIKVIDSETKEMIRQIPSEDVLSMARHLKGDPGMFVSVEA